MDSLERYIQEIKTTVFLTREEEIQLAIQMKAGDPILAEQARNKLISANLLLVVSIAQTYNSQAGLPLLDMIAEGNIGLMRSVDTFDHSKGFRLTTYATFIIKNQILGALNRSHEGKMASLNIRDDNGKEWIDDIPDTEDSITDRMITGEAVRKMMTFIPRLHEREQAVIRLRYGLDGKPMSLVQVGIKLGVSHECIRLIQKGALHKLKRYMEGRP